MNKKSSLLIGALSTVAIAIPLAVTTSCTDTTGMQYIGIMAKQTVTANITDREVSASSMTKTTLDKVFDGITTVNFNQFTSAWDSSNRKIILTSKEGFEFGLEKNKMESKILNPVIDLNISLNTDIGNNVITKKEINADPITKETLLKAYNGITDENMRHFTVSYVKVPNINPPLYAFILVANEGYGFNNQMGNQLPSMTFNVKEDITYINISAKADITTRITDKELSANPISKLTLDKAFDGITDMNFSQFISNWDSTKNQIILTAGPGYKFGTEASSVSTIESKPITVVQALNISLNKNVHNYLITKEEIDVPQISKATLDKAFIGITDENMNNFTTSLGTIGKLYFLVLTANDGYGFGDRIGDQFVSMTFNITTILNITSKIIPDKIYKEELEGVISIETVSKAFNGITEQNKDNFTVALNEAKNKIVLKVKPGYKFGSEALPKDTIESASIDYISTLNITAKTGIIKISNSELTANPLAAETIKKAFNVPEGDINKFSATWESTTNKITLKANAGFEFGTINSSKPTLDSNEITLINFLDITKKDKIDVSIYNTELSPKVLESALIKAFNGITAGDLDTKFTATWDAGTGIITLTAKDNNEFIDGTSLVKVITSIQITPITLLNIELKENVKIPESELITAMDIATLEKAFTFNFQNPNLSFFDVGYDPATKKITLEAKAGFEIQTSTDAPTKTIYSNPITVQLDITANPSIPLPESAITEPITEDVLKLAFTGFSIENIKYIKTAQWDSMARQITLVLNEGYEFLATTAATPNTLISNPITVQLNITANTGIKILESDFNKEIDLPLLQIVFKGITDINKINLTSTSWDKVNRTITLVLNDGYEFLAPTVDTAKNSLVSNPIIIKLQIVALPSPIEIPVSELTPNKITQATLIKAFEGITNDNYLFIESTAWNATGAKGIITLTLKTGFEFENTTTLDTLISNEITSITTLIVGKTINPKILEKDITITNETLNKVFTINADDFGKFTSAWNETKNKIILTANDGYIFENSLKSIESNPIIIQLPISQKDGAIEILASDIANSPISIENLRKAFNGISDFNYNKVTSAWVPSLNPSTPNTGQINLTLGEGYEFSLDSSKSITSRTITLVTILNITKQDLPKIFQSEKDATLITNETLQKVFNIYPQDFDKVTATWTADVTDNSKWNITLTAKDNFRFETTTGEFTNKLISNTITIDSNTFLNITQILAPVYIPEQELSGTLTLPTLKRAFNIIDDTYFDHFISSWDSTNNKITLKANPGYQFNDLASTATYEILSNEITPVIILNITPNENPNILQSEFDANTISPLVLKKVFNFNNIENNINNVTSDWDTPKTTISLTAKTNFVFEVAGVLSKTLKSKTITITPNNVLNIIPTGAPVYIPKQELSGNLSITTLKRAFSTITEADLAHIEASYSLGKITLKAQNGFQFGDSNSSTPVYEITSNPITEVTLLDVTLAPTISPINWIEVGGGIEISIDTLIKAFGITNNNDYPTNFTAKWEATDSDPLTGKIILTALNDYIFTESTGVLSKTLTSGPITTSLIKLDITSPADVKILESKFNNPIIDLPLLQKVFIGIDNTNKVNIKSASWDKGRRQITLVLNDGYVFLSQTPNTNTLVSEPIIIQLNITAKQVIQSTDKIFLSELTGAKFAPETLNKIFDGITVENYEFIATTEWKATRTVGIITLNLKDGYEFEIKTSTPLNTLDSISITALSLLDVTTKTPDKIYVSELSPNVLASALEKAFTGITAADLDTKFTATWVAGTGIITLTANEGYEFGNTTLSEKSIASIKITPITLLPIFKKDKIDVSIYTSELSPNLLISALLKAFNGIVAGDFNTKFTATWDNAGSGKITLTPKTGFEFGDLNLQAATLDSIVITP
ncbi:MAG: hypothetical protein ACRDBR_02080, partial [Metamycoplasmataceae bacterium]